MKTKCPCSEQSQGPTTTTLSSPHTLQRAVTPHHYIAPLSPHIHQRAATRPHHYTTPPSPHTPIARTTALARFVLIVCVDVLQPNQPIMVISSRSIYLTTLFFLDRLKSSKQLTSTCAHSFARNWQLPFLSQQKRENGRREYFMINLHKRRLLDPAGIRPATSLSPVRRASDWASEAGRIVCGKN